MINNKTTPELHTEASPNNFGPTEEQIDAFARRMLPVLQQFFADEQIQQEFTQWQSEQSAKPDKS
ncbi:MAG: hypothetical protein FWE32_00610 [Oscillospiraceae bacterium]|nr:hypothetical protein [Oscillospiraceae bacterium]